MDIDPSARRHGIADADMLHAYRHHRVAFATDDPEVTMYVGPARDGRLLEVAVVVDDSGAAVIHAMPARSKFVPRGTK